MTIEEIEQKLNECQKALAELKESKKEGKWKPTLNQEYWFRSASGSLEVSNWEDDELDNGRYNNIPIFKTDQECRRYWHFMDTVKEKSYEFSKEEWEDENIRKHLIYYDFENKEFVAYRTIISKYFGEIYFKTKEDAQYIIDNFKDELMEYFL